MYFDSDQRGLYCYNTQNKKQSAPIEKVLYSPALQFEKRLVTKFSLPYSNKIPS